MYAEQKAASSQEGRGQVQSANFYQFLSEQSLIALASNSFSQKAPQEMGNNGQGRAARFESSQCHATDL
jgi:hypothetical protein